MINYLKADCKRVFRRIPRIIIMLIMIGIFDYFLIKETGSDGWNSVKLLGKIEDFIEIYIFCAGFIEFVYIFASDLKAKTMQVGIAMGIKRRRVIGTKYLDIAVLSFVDLLFFMANMIIIGTVTGAGLKAFQFRDVIVIFVIAWLSIIAYTSFGTLVTLFMQNASLGALVYLIISFNFVNMGLKYIFDLKFIRCLKLSNYILTGCISKFKAQLMVGVFDIRSGIVIAIYLVGVFLICCRIFRKKELSL